MLPLAGVEEHNREVELKARRSVRLSDKIRKEKSRLRRRQWGRKGGMDQRFQQVDSKQLVKD